MITSNEMARELHLTHPRPDASGILKKTDTVILIYIDVVGECNSRIVQSIGHISTLNVSAPGQVC